MNEWIDRAVWQWRVRLRACPCNFVSVQTAATLSTNCNWCFCVRTAKATFHIGNFCFWVPFLKQLLLRNCAVDFVEICNIYIGKMIIKAAKRIFYSDKICCSYSNLNFGVTFFGTQCINKCIYLSIYLYSNWTNGHLHCDGSTWTCSPPMNDMSAMTA